jgi:type I restriction enzyme S subunit
MLQLFLKIKPDLVRMGYGGGQPNISQDTIKGLRLPIPSIEEQGDIVTFIENETATIDYAITHAKREIELMREYRTRLISDVVTGQVDVRGIEVPDVAEDELLALVEDTGEADEVIDDEGEMDETD